MQVIKRKGNYYWSGKIRRLFSGKKIMQQSPFKEAGRHYLAWTIDSTSGTAYIVFKWIIRSKYLPKGQKWRQDLITKKSYNSEKHRKRIHHKQKCHFRNSSKNDSSTTARSKTYQMNQSSNGFWSDNKNYHSNGC